VIAADLADEVVRRAGHRGDGHQAVDRPRRGVHAQAGRAEAMGDEHPDDEAAGALEHPGHRQDGAVGQDPPGAAARADGHRAIVGNG
jgi:hypothetical protein